jgi:hypothetical protein
VVSVRLLLLFAVCAFLRFPVGLSVVWLSLSALAFVCGLCYPCLGCGGSWPSRVLFLWGCAVVASSGARFGSFLGGVSAGCSVRRLPGGAALVVPLSFCCGLGGLVAAWQLARWLGLPARLLRAPGVPGSLSVAWWLVVAPSRRCLVAAISRLSCGGFAGCSRFVRSAGFWVRVC